jgi:hypothetical protein
MKDKIVEVGCSIVAAAFLAVFFGIIFLFILPMWSAGLFDSFSESEAKEMEQSTQFKELESYLLNHPNVREMRFKGWKKTNVWLINQYLMDFSTNEILLIPPTVNTTSKKALKTTWKVVPLTIETFKAQPTKESAGLDIDQLKVVATYAKELGFISIVKNDSLSQIRYRIQYNSPLAPGFGIVYYKDSTLVDKKMYDEVQFISNTHYRFLEGVE